MNTSRENLFEADLLHLRDNLYTAIASGEAHRTREGFTIFQTLIAEMLKHHHVLESRLIEPHPLGRTQVSGIYGWEWGEILRSLYDLESASSRSLERRTRRDFIDFLFRIVSNSAQQGSILAVKDVLDVIVSVWSAASQGVGNWIDGESQYLLLRLTEVSAYALHDDRDSDIVSQFDQMTVRAFIQAAKTSIDVGDDESAMSVLAYLDDTYIGATESVRSANYAKLTAIGQVALSGWILHKYDPEQPTSHHDILRNWLQSKLAARDDLWNIGREVHSPEAEAIFGWTWWETPPERGRMSGGFLQLSTYLTIATMLVAPQGIRIPDSTTIDDDDLGMAQRFQRLTAEFLDGKWPKLEALYDRASIESLNGRVSAVIQADLLRVAQELAQTPISRDRVQEFVKYADELFSQHDRGLLSFLPEAVLDDEPPAMGHNRLESKSIFIPGSSTKTLKSVAESLVRSMTSGEDERVIDILRGRDPAATVGAQDVSSVVNAWADQQAQPETLLVVTNSWLALESLDSADPGTWDNGTKHHLTVGGVRIHRVFDSNPPFVAAFDTVKGIQHRRGTPPTELETDQLVSAGRLLVGVSELTTDQISELMERNGEMTEIELRQRVVVRMLECVAITIGDTEKLVTWVLPDDAF